MLRKLVVGKTTTSCLLSRDVFGLRNQLVFCRSKSTESENSNKKKQTVLIKSLRRSSPNEQQQTAGYILSLLNKNNEPKKIEVLEKYLSTVTSITVGELIDLPTASKLLHGYEQSIIIPDEVLNIQYEHQDLMVLANGTLVGWGLCETTLMEKFIPLIEKSITAPCDPESEEMDWVKLNTTSDGETSHNDNSYMQGEIMVLQGERKNKVMLDKAAFAIGFSRSTRLSVLENDLEKHIQLTKSNVQHLSTGKRITTTESDILKLTGRLFLLRGKLNLYSELIETPDLCWTEPTLEKIYESISRNLDISPRISILNRKLDYATEEQRALLSVLNEKKSTRLEWIIILLIMVEVGFEINHFYEQYTKQLENEP